jgi:hypothetical protein
MSARLIRTLGLVACVLGLVAVAPAASAGHKTDPLTKNLHPLGHIEEPRSLINPRVGNTNIPHRHRLLGQARLPGELGRLHDPGPRGARQPHDHLPHLL